MRDNKKTGYANVLNTHGIACFFILNQSFRLSF